MHTIFFKLKFLTQKRIKTKCFTKFILKKYQHTVKDKTVNQTKTSDPALTRYLTSTFYAAVSP